MQSYRVHHCVLIFLTLTFTTAPVSAAVCSVLAKLHQSVTLPCEHRCSGSAKWTLFNNRDVIFTHCNQTSCWSLEGYGMAHDRYLNGDLSLTITAADYSMRDTYACECGISDMSRLRLRIETVTSAIQLKSGEDLVIDLSVPEPVEVIYKPTDSAGGEQICTVTQHTLQCKPEYTPRTSLSDRKLTLRHVTLSDSGTYTIWDMKNNEDICVYIVSVTDEQSGIPPWVIIVIVLVLLVLFITGVVLYLKISRYQEFITLSRRLQHVDKRVKQAQPRQDEKNESFNMTGAALKKAEKEIDKLEDQYSRKSEYSEQVSLFCRAKRSELDKYRLQYSSEDEHEPLVIHLEGIMRKMEEVMKVLQQLRGGAGREQQVAGSNSTTVMDPMENQVEKHLEEIEQWCGEKRVELKDLMQHNVELCEIAD